ncbi:MAG: DUF58 domain-containing protein [Chloroflexi bacterium]|nr:DUF58 domain-containing protein [Chloroflexota bacterium]
MSRTWFLGSLILFLLLAGLVALRGTLVALAIPLLLYLLYGLWFGPNDVRLEVQRDLSAERVAPQTPVKVRVTITNRGDDLEELALEDVIDPVLTVQDGSNHHLISLSKNKGFVFEYTMSGPRGGFPLETVHVEAGDHLGVLRTIQDVRTFGQLFVFPTVARLKQVPIRPRRTRVYAGTIPARVGGTGIEFFGVREYQDGDSPRHINWRVSARSAENLYANEFQQERVADVGIVLDGRERSNLFIGRHSLFEHSVLAAASLADTFLARGDRVGLLVYSRYLQWTWPGYGKLQRERILHALSRAMPGVSQIFDGLQYLPTRMFPPESQIVLVSPLVEDDYSTLIQLRARGYQVLVVSPDPVTFEEDHLPRRTAEYSNSEIRLAARVIRMERSLMLKRIQRAGIQVMDWNVAQPFDQAARRAFARQIQAGSRL